MEITEAQQIVEETAKLYDQIADHFDMTRIHLWPEFDYFTPFLHFGQSVLDIGCGNGRLVKLLENRGIRYLGVDASAKLISKAEEKAKNREGVQFQVGNVLNLSALEGTFDVVFAIAVLQHLPLPLFEEALKQISSKLKPGGTLLMTNWNMWQKKFLWIRFEQWMKRLASPQEKVLGLPRIRFGFNDVFVFYQMGDRAARHVRYLYAYSPRVLESLLKKHGFTVERNHYCSGNKQVSWWKAKNIVTIATKNSS